MNTKGTAMTRGQKQFENADARRDLLTTFVLRLPKGAYTIDSIRTAAEEKFGWQAGLWIDERFLRGIASLHDSKLWCSFTLGLQEVIRK